MARIDEINGKRVLPGDPVCVIEEFMPGVGTFEDNGVVRAAIPGVTQADLVTRTVHIRPAVQLPRIPEKNSVIVGIVTVVKDEFAIIKIVKDVKGAKFHSGFTGLLHISQASDRFVKNLYEVIRVGDVIRAKVLNDAPPYNLTLREPKLGVVVGFCGNCGKRMKKAGPETLKCPACGRVEKRKVSYDYGNLKGILS